MTDIDLSPEGLAELRRWLTQEQAQGASERYSLLKRREELLDAKFASALSAEGAHILGAIRRDLDVIATEQRLIPIALALLDAYEEALEKLAESEKKVDELYCDHMNFVGVDD